MALQRGVYRPRDAEHAVLHQVIAEHLEAFLRAVATFLLYLEVLSAVLKSPFEGQQMKRISTS